MSIAISAERLTKIYRLGTIGGVTLQEDVARWWAKVRRKPDPLLKIGLEQDRWRTSDQFVALRDVSFEVTEGEVVGIIGRNGAGKSTLLKILAQVTAPTFGKVAIRGRVASLLEVGTGFHPDLTGRENVFLNGAIMGMTKAEVRSKFDEIVAFSECEPFIDTPVKRYSSGMYVRLAFAVAAHLEPEVLVIDEVLAVGDALFQKKCLGKIGEVSRGGRTVLFVSHNMVAVQNLCRRAILLRHGAIAAEGPARSIVSDYFLETHHSQNATEWPSFAMASGTEALRIKRINVRATHHRGDGLIAMTSPIQVDTDFWVATPGQALHLTYVLLNEQGIVVLTTFSSSERRNVGLHRASFEIPGNLLNSGSYVLRLLIVQNGNRVVYEHDAIACFNVVDLGDRDGGYVGREPGVVQPVFAWNTMILEDNISPEECASTV